METRLLSIPCDAPVTVSVADSEERIRGLNPLPDEAMNVGPIPMSDVEVIEYVRQEGAWA
jgi:PII-like signaling protein